MIRDFIVNLLFEKQPATFQSDFGMQESVDRLGSKVSHWPQVNSFYLLAPFVKPSLVGIVNENEVSIKYLNPPGHNSFKPVFQGAFQMQGDTVVLDGYFAMSRYVSIFQKWWLGFAIFFAFLWTILMVLVLPMITGITWQKKLIGGFVTCLMPWGMVVFGLVLVTFGKWLARNDATIISQAIWDALRSSDSAPMSTHR